MWILVRSPLGETVGLAFLMRGCDATPPATLRVAGTAALVAHLASLEPPATDAGARSKRTQC